MGFFSNIAKAIFGGNDDEERKKKLAALLQTGGAQGGVLQKPAAIRRAGIVQNDDPADLQPVTPETQNAIKLTLPQKEPLAEPAPSLQLKKAEPGKPVVPEKKNAVEQVLQGGANVATNIVKGIGSEAQAIVTDPLKEASGLIRAPFRSAASLARQAGDNSDFQSTPLRRFVFGDQPIESLSEKGQAAANLSLDERDIAAGRNASVTPLALLGLGALSAGSDLTPVGIGKKALLKKSLERGAEKTLPDAAESLVRASDKTPAYQRQIPTTVGQAAQQAKNGIYNVPDELLSADVRNAAQVPDGPLDVPTFMRRNAPAIIEDSQAKLDMLDGRIDGIRGVGSPIDDFNNKQAIALAFNESPAKGQALANLIGSRSNRVDPEAALSQAVGERASVVGDLRAAEDARRAQTILDGRLIDAPVDAPQNLARVDQPAIPAFANVSEAPSVGGVQRSLADAPDQLQPAPAPAVVPTGGALPTIEAPQPLGGEMLPVAPRTHDALVRELGPSADVKKGQYSERNKVNLEELKQRSEGAIANMDDDSVIQAFQSVDPKAMINDSNSFGLARAALGRLSQLDDPNAAQAVKNIMDSMEKYVSKSGEGLRIVQEDFDAMPVPMKIRYITKKIDSANADKSGYEPLARDPERAAQVEANLGAFLQKSQSISENIARLQGQLEDAAQSAARSEAASVNTKAVAQELKDQQRALSVQNGELVKYYQTLMPSKGIGKVNDIARQMMLSSFTGRINDIVTTGANVADLGGRNITQGIIAKGVNLVRPGTVTDTLKGGSRIATGGNEGLKKSISGFSGDINAPDLKRALETKNGSNTRSGLDNSQGRVGRIVQSATEMATNLSEGVIDQRLYQLADQEAAKLGLEGPYRKAYSEARAAVPSRDMIAKAEQLHKEINNLNENPVTQTLNRVAASIEGTGPVGGFLKNQILPFTSWLGGNIWNTLTDRNVVANVVNLTRSSVRGDAEGVVRNLAKTLHGAAETYALGYLLSESGLITNEDAEGYNDAGAYFHIGDRYIPVGFAGAIAPNIVLGNAAFKAMNNPDGGSIANNIATGAADAIVNLAKSTQVGTALGAENNVVRSFQAGSRPGGGLEDGLATFGAGAVGQFIPGFAGDVNAVLNNATDLNPTKEAADTKVIDPNSKSGQAKDVPRSALNGVINRIPVASQLALPRKKDVAADDGIDRITRGNRDTPGGTAAKAQATEAKSTADDLKARNVPDYTAKGFDDAIQARFENGDYKSGIEGLQKKITSEYANKDLPKSKIKKDEDKMKLFQLHDAKGYDPTLVDTYKKTTVAEWRKLGDPESDTYDPETYKKLWEYDSERAKLGISKNTDKGDKNAFSAKAVSTKKGGSGGSGGGRGSAESKELSRIRSNTLGDAPKLSRIDLKSLAPEKVSSASKIPTIAEIKPGELIKKRTISVKSKA